jgi:hypothetical protein
MFSYIIVQLYERHSTNQERSTCIKCSYSARETCKTKYCNLKFALYMKQPIGMPTRNNQNAPEGTGRIDAT